jgi:5-(hydroxymethyl)furfural/furfural oxidase
MQIFPSNRTSWHPLGRRIGALTICLYKPFSIGVVQLRSRDANDEPIVKFNLLNDERDFARMTDALAMAARFLLGARSRGFANEVFLPPGGQANSLNRPSAANWAKSVLINLLFNASRLRTRMLRDRILDLERLASDKDYCATIVRLVSAPVHHVCGTCRMGAKSDPLSVVDSKCRTYDVKDLRVVDASVMPTVVAANTHLATHDCGKSRAHH